MMQTQLLGLGSAVDTGALQRPKDKEQQQGECQGLQARVIQLEGEVLAKKKLSVFLRWLGSLPALNPNVKF